MATSHSDRVLSTYKKMTFSLVMVITGTLLLTLFDLESYTGHISLGGVEISNSFFYVFSILAAFLLGLFMYRSYDETVKKLKDL